MDVFVINMIPKSLSGEQNQDSEPNLAVNPANPLQASATAFTPDPLSGPPLRQLWRLRIFGQRDKLKADRSKGA